METVIVPLIHVGAAEGPGGTITGLSGISCSQGPVQLVTQALWTPTSHTESTDVSALQAVVEDVFRSFT